MGLITLFSITFSISAGVNLTKEKGYLILLDAGSCDDSTEWKFRQHQEPIVAFDSVTLFS